MPGGLFVVRGSAELGVGSLEILRPEESADLIFGRDVPYPGTRFREQASRDHHSPRLVTSMPTGISIWPSVSRPTCSEISAGA